MSLLTDVSVAAAIAAVPSTLSAFAVFYAGRVKRDLATNGSGFPLGKLVEHINTKLDTHLDDFSTHTKDFDLHLKDFDLHRQDMADHVQETHNHADGTMCPDCGTLL